MANEYYNSSVNPATNSSGSSSLIRAEFAAMVVGFDKLPLMAGNAGKLVKVNSGGTAFTTSTGSISLGGPFTTTGAFSLTLTSSATVVLTLPSTGTILNTADASIVTTFGTWTPTLAFSTVGNTSLVYSTQVGNFVQAGRLVYATFSIITSTFTHTTASGSLSVVGFPSSPSQTVSSNGDLALAGDNTGATAVEGWFMNLSGTLGIITSIRNSGTVHSDAQFQAADHTTGVNMTVRGSIVYRATA